MTEPKPKPCPLCGQIPTLYHPIEGDFVYCNTKNCLLYWKDILPEAWNTRPIETQLLEACKVAVHAMSYDAAQSTSEYMDALDTLQAAIAAAEGAP